MSDLPDDARSSCDNKSDPSQRQSVENETIVIGKTVDHSMYEVQTLNSSNRQCCSTLTKDDCYATVRDTTENARYVPKQEEIDAAPARAEVVIRDNVVSGASGGGNKKSQDVTHRTSSTADTSFAIMQKDETTNVAKERSSMLRSSQQSDRDCGSELSLVTPPTKHHYVKSRVATEMKPIRYITRTSSITHSVIYPRVPAQLMPFCDTNVTRKYVSEQQRRGLQPTTAQAPQDDAGRKACMSIRPNETYCNSTNVSKFPLKITQQPPSDFGERGRESMSISTRTENGANALRQHLSLADSSIRSERSTISDQPKPFNIRTTSFTHSGACGIQATNTGINILGGPRSTSNAMMFAPFGVTRDEPPNTEPPKRSTDGDAGPENATYITRNDSTIFRDHRGCGSTGDERASLGDEANPATPRILGRISEHKGVLYQRIPWDGCIQVSSTGMSRATVIIFVIISLAVCIVPSLAVCIIPSLAVCIVPTLLCSLSCLNDVSLIAFCTISRYQMLHSAVFSA